MATAPVKGSCLFTHLEHPCRAVVLAGSLNGSLGSLLKGEVYGLSPCIKILNSLDGLPNGVPKEVFVVVPGLSWQGALTG